MTEKRFKVHTIWFNPEKTDGEHTIKYGGQPLITTKSLEDAEFMKDLLNELYEENEKLKQSQASTLREFAKGTKKIQKLAKENEELKKELAECKINEKQLGISFMGYKMQLIEVLQQNYDYAYNQRQKNLDKSIVARYYEVLYQTIMNIAEAMNIDIERFPKR